MIIESSQVSTRELNKVFRDAYIDILSDEDNVLIIKYRILNIFISFYSEADVLRITVLINLKKALPTHLLDHLNTEYLLFKFTVTDNGTSLLIRYDISYAKGLYIPYLMHILNTYEGFVPALVNDKAINEYLM